MLSFTALDTKQMLTPLYLNKENNVEFARFNESLSSYAAALAEFKGENESTLVANVLKPFFERLDFDKVVAGKGQESGKSEIDLALLKDDKVAVIVEAKRQGSADMFSPENINCKALHEAILYYFRERDKGSASVKFIIITDFMHFYIFRHKQFEDFFYQNDDLRQIYANFAPSLASKRSEKFGTKDFYAKLKEHLESLKFENHLQSLKKHLFDGGGGSPHLEALHLDFHLILKDNKDKKPFCKAFHRDFLFDEFNPNDANILDDKFYKELLYILGLKRENTRSNSLTPSGVIGTLYESVFVKLAPHKQNHENAMSLIILWLNRILFLKLIESNLVRFNADKSLKFLSFDKISHFVTLKELFFDILAKPFNERAQHSAFSHLPYLNSSLFLRAEIENPNSPKFLLEITNLKESELDYFSATQLKDKKGKCKAGKVPFLRYLFDFLDAFDFGSFDEESGSKTLINSSVLGLVFEQLNAYKEGNFYTPSFITSYMCRASLEKVVLAKFKELGLNADTLATLKGQILININADFAFKQKAICTLNSIRICDPAVGSGHFLVSALNEMVRIHYELGLFDCYVSFLHLKDDEIFIDNFAYTKAGVNSETQGIQKALFHLKKSIIENNLFGVDINENSCNICRLRLWIELLKNSYYLTSSDENFDEHLSAEIHQIQTLPNIDINIKCGNSLISRFTLKDSFADEDIKKQVKDYKALVFDYKNADKAKFRISKDELETKIKALKQGFVLSLTDFKTKNALQKALETHLGRYGNFLLDDKRLFSGLVLQQSLNFDDINLDEKTQEKAVASFAKIKLLRIKLDTTLSGESYKNAFEWRFEFPEVLNEQGEFMGFDLVVGNPPYIRQEEIKELKPQLAKAYEIYTGTSDIYTYFYEQGFKALKVGGILSFITSNKFARAGYGEKLREFLLDKTTLLEFVDLNGLKVFENAVVDTSVSFAKAKASKTHKFNYANPSLSLHTNETSRAKSSF